MLLLLVQASILWEPLLCHTSFCEFLLKNWITASFVLFCIYTSAFWDSNALSSRIQEVRTFQQAKWIICPDRIIVIPHCFLKSPRMILEKSFLTGVSNPFLGLGKTMSVFWRESLGEESFHFLIPGVDFLSTTTCSALMLFYKTNV